MAPLGERSGQTSDQKGEQGDRQGGSSQGQSGQGQQGSGAQPGREPGGVEDPQGAETGEAGETGEGQSSPGQSGQQGRSSESQGQRDDIGQSAASDDPLDLTPLVRVAAFGFEMAPGDVRLVGISRQDPIEGLTVSPAAAQTRSAALVVAHLRYGADDPPVADHNCRQQFAKKPLSVSGERELPEGE